MHHEPRLASRGERGVGQDVDALLPRQAQRFPGFARLELQRQHAHAHQVAAVDALEAARHHRAYAQQLRALGRPVAAGAGAVLFARKHHRGHAFGLVALGSVEDGQLVARGLVQRPAALLARAIGQRGQHEVLDAHIGKGAAHHDFVVAPARAVAVEVGLVHTMLQQPLACGGAFLDGACGGDVVGGDGIAKQGHGACTLHSHRI